MNLQMIIAESGLEISKAKTLLDQFQNFFELADQWELSAKTLVVSNDTDIETMAIAGKALVKVKEKIKEIEKVRKSLKEESLKEGQSIDSIARILKNLLSPIAEHLDQQANYTKYKIEAEQHRVEQENIKMLQKKEAERLEQEALARKKLQEENKILQEQLKIVEQKRLEEEKIKLSLQKEVEQKRICPTCKQIITEGAKNV